MLHMSPSDVTTAAPAGEMPPHGPKMVEQIQTQSKQISEKKQVFADL